jgi:hypothetical protein
MSIDCRRKSNHRQLKIFLFKNVFILILVIRLEREGIGMARRRTIHGQQRHRESDRPTEQAFQDKEKPREVYLQRDGRIVYVGKNGRTHIFEDDVHLTSFRMTKRARERKMRMGWWQKLS